MQFESENYDMLYLKGGKVCTFCGLAKVLSSQNTKKIGPANPESVTIAEGAQI
jgi:hypothetical protein